MSRFLKKMVIKEAGQIPLEDPKAKSFVGLLLRFEIMQIEHFYFQIVVFINFVFSHFLLRSPCRAINKQNHIQFAVVVLLMLYSFFFLFCNQQSTYCTSIQLPYHRLHNTPHSSTQKPVPHNAIISSQILGLSCSDYWWGVPLPLAPCSLKLVVVMSD